MKFPLLHPKTDKLLANIRFAEKDEEKVIQNLDSNKAHKNDMIRICMVKICGKSIIKPSLIIYKKCFGKGLCSQRKEESKCCS